ncbi:MAG: isopentenyl-diphosphate Delta-isomerase [Opitutaceae bacterium]|nr:isopentenyl-diphosphate Delta-isomerase [Opitutaceae bacterium]
MAAWHSPPVETTEEMVVILDQHGVPLGCEPKATVHHACTPLHLAFSVFLFDGAGRTLFQQRAFHKRTWPGVWSNACCGHPTPGEALVAAAQRRLRYELGTEGPVDLALTLPHFRYRARWGDLWENEVCPVFTGRYDGPFTPNPDEVASVRWIRWSDFARGCRSDAPSEFDAFSPWSRWEAAELLALPQFAIADTSR